MPNATNAKKKSPSRRSQAERTAESEERLMRAALKLIGERGYDRTTLAAIGEEAGYSRGLVSHRYGSKAGLLGAITREVVDRWHEEKVVPAVGDKVGADALCAAIDAIIRESKEQPDELRALNVILFDPNPELRERIADMHANFRTTMRAIIAHGQEAGAVSSAIDPEVSAALFVSSLRGALYQWSLDPESVPLEDILRLLQDQVRTTLLPTRSQS